MTEQMTETDAGTLRWTVLVPLRAMPTAKSRLAATIAPELFERVVEAIRADTLAAVRASAAVARVVVVSDQAGDGVDLVQRSPGLNGALRDGAAHSAREWPGDGVAALVGDLPALRTAELTAALAAAAGHPSAFVADADGTGTTLLAARPGTRLAPGFGLGSAARHAQTAAALGAGPGLRQDVDTADDLAGAIRLGVGPATAAALGVDRVVTRSP